MIVFSPDTKSTKFRLASGEADLDGSNPTPVATGLHRILAVALTLKGSATPGDSTMCLTYTVTGGTISVYAWKTNGSDPTLIASTGTETFSWSAIGY